MKTLALVMTLALSLTAQAARVNYGPESENDAVTLSMEPVVPGKTSFQMELFTVNPFSTNMCELEETFQIQADGLTFVAEPNENCRITVEFDNKKFLRASIEQEGSDTDCDCGAGVTLDGRVKLKKPKR